VQIAFTGSREVGLAILEQAGKTLEGQRSIKRVVCEMGGKNAIIVDADADLDEALAGVVISAFGYAGQKCSACSRVIVADDIYPIFVERLKAACAELTLAPAHVPECEVPPVIDEPACARLRDLIANPAPGARALFIGETPSPGWFVPVALFEVDDPAHPLMQEELFGPVLTLIRAATFDDALRIANDSRYALTGGLYSRQPSHIERARAAFRIGNLYINRGSTGAMVGRQAFGGFAMSGGGTKAGGPGYLRHFADPRSITENTMRRGFAPEETSGL
jgi:RHH-type proline utilization regulon transcriptional repressor/proline dehydrogenase/delta 1-pyrroline-5-carboxylate dehydrogenase